MASSPKREERRSGRSADDQRRRFERDRDRILYTRAFRRLAGVTQVARANESYTYHDRLSHSLKVAQIGRRLAEHFNMDEGPEIPNGLEVDPDVVETAALAHDIGHPPFGHAAEQELHKKIEGEYNINDGFEGNAQSFRVVTRLCISRREGEGLDLTLASLNAILKYPWARGRDENEWGVKENKKWGVYESDIDAFNDARQLSEVNKRRSAEAGIMDWADDLAYAVHDVEDFYRAGIIPLDQLLTKDSQEREDFVQDWANAKNRVSPDEGHNILDYISEIAGSELKTPFGGSEVEQLDLNELRSKLIARYLGIESGGLELQNHNNNRHFLQIQDYLLNEVSLLKHMTVYYVIRDSGLAAQQRGQRKIVGELFEILFDAARPKDSDNVESIHLVPNRFQAMAERVRERSHPRARARFAADVICSLTEKQATQLYKRLVGNAPGSLQDRILR